MKYEFFESDHKRNRCWQIRQSKVSPTEISLTASVDPHGLARQHIFALKGKRVLNGPDAVSSVDQAP